METETSFCFTIFKIILVIGSYDPEKSISENTAIASPLLSRFDLVLTLLDTKNPEWDMIVSSFILEGKEPFKEKTPESKPIWSFEKIQEYFSYIKKLSPLLGPGANSILSNYYQRQRNTDSMDQARTTVRLLQSCIRLAQGHARLMCRDEVQVQDAVCAVLLLECSTSSSASLVKGGNALHTTFPLDPLEEYKTQAKLILTGLNLHHLWVAEKDRIDRLKSCSGSVSASQCQTQVPPRTERDKNLSQVMKAIQINRLPSYPTPDIEINKKKRKRRVRTPEEKAETGDKNEKFNPEPEVFISSEEESEKGEEKRRKKSEEKKTNKRDSGSESIGSESESADVITSTQVMPRVKKKIQDSCFLSPPELEADVSCIPRFPAVGISQEDEPQSPGSPGVPRVPSPRSSTTLSRKTLKKLQSFSKLDDSETEKEKKISSEDLDTSPNKSELNLVLENNSDTSSFNLAQQSQENSCSIQTDPCSNIKPSSNSVNISRANSIPRDSFKSNSTTKPKHELTSDKLNSLMSKIKKVSKDPLLQSNSTLEMEQDLDLDFDFDL